MTELWIPITIAAAFLQCVRTAIQKQLKADLSTNAATFTRFFYGLPVAVVYVAGLLAFAGMTLPPINPTFLGFALLGGICQIIATSLLIYLFGLRNFAVGTTYSKTESVQTALFGIVILAEPVSAGGLFAIVVSMTGVMVLSIVKSQTGWTRLFTAWTDRAAVIGLLSGAFFGVTAVSIRAAALSLGEVEAWIAAAYTLLWVIGLQTAIMGVYMAWRERSQLPLVLSTWRRSGLVGVTAVLGSIGWFTAMTMQNAAYVRTVGQIELVFTFLVSYFVFRERSSASEVVGILLIVAGIILLLNFR